MKTILSVVVGSRLHKLNNDKSDWDIRGIFMHEPKELHNPFSKPKNTSWIEADEDNTAYELKDFCKFAVQGNATILEILYSNIIRLNTPIGEELQANRIKFLDSRRIFEAHKGYSNNQYTKMKLFEPDQRTPKFAVAYLRVLQQGIQLLETGEFSPQVVKDRDFILDVKYNFRSELIPELSKRFAKAQVDFADTFAKYHDKFKPDIDWIVDFCVRAYENK